MDILRFGCLKIGGNGQVVVSCGNEQRYGKIDGDLRIIFEMRSMLRN
jgi:hypothetical protein